MSMSGVSTPEWTHFIESFALSVVATLAIERLSRWLNLFDQPGLRKLHKHPVSRLGGLAFVSVALFFLLERVIALHWSVIAGAGVVFVGGFYDDLRPANSAGIKLLFQIPASLLFALYCPLESLTLSSSALLWVRLLIFAYVLFMINAANLMDNMNGLTSGLSMLWLGGLTLLAYRYESAASYRAVLLVLIASVGGFYLRNFPWGKVYMGDQGSQFLGFLNAALSVLILPSVFVERGHAQAAVAMTCVSLLLLSLVFIVDVCTVIVIRLKEHRPVWQGDQCHLSHQLLRKGFSQVKSALLLSGVQGLLTLLAYTSVVYFVEGSF